MHFWQPKLHIRPKKHVSMCKGVCKQTPVLTSSSGINRIGSPFYQLL